LAAFGVLAERAGAPAPPRGGVVAAGQQIPHRAFCPVRNDKGLFALAELRALAAYNNYMRQPIRVDNSRPVSVYDTARILGVSKKRTEAIIREVERTIHRDAKTGGSRDPDQGMGKDAWES